MIDGADLFLGLSGPGVLTGEMVRRMAARPIVFALANPAPEIMPDDVRKAVPRVLDDNQQSDGGDSPLKRAWSQTAGLDPGSRLIRGLACP